MVFYSYWYISFFQPTNHKVYILTGIYSGMGKTLNVKVNQVSRAIRMSIPQSIAIALGISPGDTVNIRESRGKMIVEKVCETNANNNQKP